MYLICYGEDNHGTSMRGPVICPQASSFSDLWKRCDKEIQW